MTVKVAYMPFLDSALCHQGEWPRGTVGWPMLDQLVIEHLEFQGRCGVTEQERLVPQPLAVDLVLDYPPGGPSRAIQSDDLSQAIDYARIVERVVSVGTDRPFHLLETLGEQLLTMIFREFPVERVSLWVRKPSPPLKQVEGSVGVRMERSRPSPPADLQPAGFLVEQRHLLPKGKALDIATGRGRNALFLAAHGWTVHGIDRDQEALAALQAGAKECGLANVMTSLADLESDPNNAGALPSESYDVVLVFFYLYRPLFPAIVRALRPGGVLVYETFLIDNHLRYHHPRRREFCLGHNELLELTKGLRVIHYDEGEHEGNQRDGRAFTARLLAMKEGTDVAT